MDSFCGRKFLGCLKIGARGRHGRFPRKVDNKISGLAGDVLEHFHPLLFRFPRIYETPFFRHWNNDTWQNSFSGLHFWALSTPIFFIGKALSIRATSTKCFQEGNCARELFDTSLSGSCISFLDGPSGSIEGSPQQLIFHKNHFNTKLSHCWVRLSLIWFGFSIY